MSKRLGSALLLGLWTLLVWFASGWVYAQSHGINFWTNQSYENYANDHAATECAEKTGFRYNCADGTQRISCE